MLRKTQHGHVLLQHRHTPATKRRHAQRPRHLLTNDVPQPTMASPPHLQRGSMSRAPQRRESAFDAASGGRESSDRAGLGPATSINAGELVVVLFEDRADGVRHDLCAEGSKGVGMCLEDYSCCGVVGERGGTGAAEDAEVGGSTCSSSSCRGM